MDQKSLSSVSAGRFHLAMKRGLMFLLGVTLISLPAFRVSAAEPFTVATIGDFGHVTVLEVSGSYDQLTADGKFNVRPRELIAQEFFRSHRDEYDFLTIFSTFDFQFKPETAAFYYGVRNDTLGIGAPLFDNSSRFGSGGRLQGTIDMGNVARLATSPLDPGFEVALDTLAHEMLHRWSATVKFRDTSGNFSTALLGKDGSHWSYLLDTRGSLQYGNSWRDNGDGTFTSVAARKYYSPLDLYLMGMLDRSQVPPMLLIDNSSLDPTRIAGAGDTISGTPRYITIDDIVAAEGERLPQAATAQKQFKMAFILIASGPPDQEQLNRIENIRKGFLTRFSILTDGQGLVQITPHSDEELTADPGGESPATQPRTLAPSIADGENWLLAAQHADGQWGRPETAGRDTAQAAMALRHFSPAGVAHLRGLQWLVESPAANADYLAAKIVALASAGENVAALVDVLVSSQNLDGGWGSDRNYQSDPLDTSSALRALLTANAAAVAVGKGVDYLLARQNPDGGWGFQADAPSNLLVTAEVTAVLQRFSATNALTTAVNKSTTNLLKHRNTDGGFGSSPSTVYETALAYRALSGVSSDMTVLAGAINYLYLSQSADGSWAQDPYSTALAIEVLHLSGIGPPEIPTTVTVTGLVVDSVMRQPQAGATISVEGDSSGHAVSAADGTFTLTDVPYGPQTIVVALDGYSTCETSASITAGAVVNLGTIVLAPDPNKGMVKGVITGASSGEPLANVSVSLTGSHNGTVFTNADGSFAFGNVTPGSITITATKTGYRTVVANGTVTAGGVLSFNPGMNLQSAPSTTGAVTGRVLDAVTNMPLGGVTAVSQSDPAIATVTDETGLFTLPELLRGEQTVAFVLQGYSMSRVTVTVATESTVNLGAVLLSSGPVVSAIRGTVSDAAGGLPLSGATVMIGGIFSGMTVTGSDGSFAVSGVSPGAVIVTAAKSGYFPVVVTGSVTAGGELFLNPRLTTMPLLATGTITGRIVDGATQAPLSGVTLSVRENATLVATSNAGGDFTLAAIPPGTQRLDFTLPGYAAASLTVDIAAGQHVDIGTFPLATHATSGMVKGTVTAAASGEPLAGVTVAVSGSYTGSAVTGAEGSFAFAEIPPGSVEVTASKQGYYAVTGTGTIVAGGGLLFSPQMVVMPPQPTTGTVTGKVVDAQTSQPLGGVMVVLGSDAAIHVETDATGCFMLSDLPSGMQSLRFSHGEYADTAADLEIAAGFVIDLGTLPLSANPTRGVLKGSITDAGSGQALEGVTIAFSGAFSGSILTGADGTFLVPEIGPGMISISVTKAGYYPLIGELTVISGAVHFFKLQLTAIPAQPETGALLGRIVDGATHEPLSGVAVVLQGNPSIAALTDAAGGFLLLDVPPGSQTCTFSLPGHVTATVTVEFVAGFSVNLGTLPLSAQPTTGIVKGKISAAADGRPLSGVTIAITGSFIGSTVTAADGIFLFPHIPPGEVELAIAKAGYEQLTAAGAIGAGGVLLINVQLREAPPAPTTSDFTGKVLDAVTAAPIAGATVALSEVGAVITDASGLFTIRGLVPSSYEVAASAPGYTRRNDQILLVAGVNTAMEIHLAPLLQTTTVSGHLVDAETGMPIAGADVVVTGTPLATITSVDGSYTLTGIELLDFYLRASVAGYDSGSVRLATTDFGHYRADLHVVPSRRGAISIGALRVDKPVCHAYDPVTITAEIVNDGTAIVEGLANLTILDPQGVVVNVQEASWSDAEGVAHNRFSFAPGLTTAVSFPWNTGFSPPGDYRLIVFVVEGEPGSTAATVADRGGTLTIQPTQALAQLTMTPSPLFTSLGATEQVGLTATVVNRSNVPTSLDLGYELRSPTGTVIHAGRSLLVLAPEESRKNIPLETLTHTFSASGSHPLMVTVNSGPLPASVLAKAISVAPGTRIDPAVTVAPGSVIPDGDKRVRIDIQLKGVELQ